MKHKLILLLLLTLMSACATYYEYLPAHNYKLVKEAAGYGDADMDTYVSYAIQVCWPQSYINTGTICRTYSYEFTDVENTFCTPSRSISYSLLNACLLQHGIDRYRITREEYHTSSYPVRKY